MSTIPRRASRALPMRTFGRRRGRSTSVSGGCGTLGGMPPAPPRWAPSDEDSVRRRAGVSGAFGPDSRGAGPARRRLSTRTRTFSKGASTRTATTRICSRVTVSRLLASPSERVLEPLRLDGQDGARGVPDDALRGAAEQEVAQVRSAPGAENNEVATDLLDELDDAPAVTWKIEDGVPGLELGPSRREAARRTLPGGGGAPARSPPGRRP